MDVFNQVRIVLDSTSIPHWKNMSVAIWAKTPLESTHQSTTEEHDRNGDMLEILRSPCTAPGSEVLEEDVGTAVQPDDERLHKFGRRNRRFPLADLASVRLDVPCPTQVCKATHPSSKGQQSIPKEDSSFHKVCKAIENVL